ncbi:hypothetical protein FQR65_LT06030 [Abscondita terminalis]|nr:hypothetical protein FQR65_LT06030 [Abscondita terminalis]
MDSATGLQRVQLNALTPDLMNIISPQIEVRKLNDSSEQFRPMVTSPYTLILNDVTTTRMLKHEGSWSPYLNLLNYTTKPIAGAVTIADIHNLKNKKIDGVDICGIIRMIGKVRSVTTRIGVRQVREITILDQTSAALRVSFWDSDIIARAGKWKNLFTVIFVTDVRCEWSDFSSSMVATFTSRSILTEDPISIESENLRDYVKKMKLSPLMDHSTLSAQDVLAIQNVMNIQQVLDKASAISSSSTVSFEEQQFTGLLYAVVTQLDLDGTSRLFNQKCSRCNSSLDYETNLCPNTECAVSDPNDNEIITSFDLRLMLSDQTGSITNCRLSGTTAENVLGCSINQFLKMNNNEKSKLKWKFLLERCSVRIHVLNTGFRGPVITILSCELSSSFDVANRLPHY